jgi:hypothetical protein
LTIASPSNKALSTKPFQKSFTGASLKLRIKEKLVLAKKLRIEIKCEMSNSKEVFRLTFTKLRDFQEDTIPEMRCG